MSQNMRCSGGVCMCFESDIFISIQHVYVHIRVHVMTVTHFFV
jgi:hypothetical protein